jgi:hypothetical protein
MATAAVLVAVTASCAEGGPTPAPAAPDEPIVAGVMQALTLTAHDIALEPAVLTVPAAVDLHVELDNRDPGIPHGLVLRAGPGFGMTLRESEIVAGPASTSIEVPGLIPGRYQFSCPVHPNMTADLTVGGP